jgi:hypothetical protein
MGNYIDSGRTAKWGSRGKNSVKVSFDSHQVRLTWTERSLHCHTAYSRIACRSIQRDHTTSHRWICVRISSKRQRHLKSHSLSNVAGPLRDLFPGQALHRFGHEEASTDRSLPGRTQARQVSESTRLLM